MLDAAAILSFAEFHFAGEVSSKSFGMVDVVNIAKNESIKGTHLCALLAIASQKIMNWNGVARGAVIFFQRD